MKKNKAKILCSFALCVTMLISASAYAVNVNTLYNGTGELNIDNPQSFEDGTQRFTAKGGFAGNYGKTEDDVIYKLDGYPLRGDGGTDYISSWLIDRNVKKTCVQTQFCVTENTSYITFHAGYFTDDNADGNNNNAGVEILKIANKKLTISTDSRVEENYRNKTIAEIENYKWYNLAIEVSYDKDVTDNNTVSVYLNGELIAKYKMTMKMYGARHFRIVIGKSLDEINKIPFEAYFDNFMISKSAYTVQSPAAVSITGYETNKNTIVDVLSQTTVADLKSAFTTEAQIRVYSDLTCTSRLSDSDVVTENTVIVTDNSNVLEYWNVTIAEDYDDLSAGIRVSNVQVCDADSNTLTDGEEAKDKYYASLTAKNLSNNEATIAVAVAVYDDEMTLADINVTNVTLAAGEVKEITAADAISVSNTLGNGNVYVYAWLDGNYMPLGNPANIEF